MEPRTHRVALASPENDAANKVTDDDAKQHDEKNAAMAKSIGLCASSSACPMPRASSITMSAQ